MKMKFVFLIVAGVVFAGKTFSAETLHNMKIVNYGIEPKVVNTDPHGLIVRLKDATGTEKWCYINASLDGKMVLSTVIFAMQNGYKVTVVVNQWNQNPSYPYIEYIKLNEPEYENKPY